MNAPRESVLLIHGLWLNGLAMLYLNHALERQGYAPDTFDYHSMRGTLAEHVAALAERVRHTPGDVVHLVAHSLGGIVALSYLGGTHDARVRRAVLLGSPVRGSEAARTLARWPAGDWLLGRSIDIWLSEFRARLDTGASVGAIAGSTPFGLGSVFMHLPGPSDGVVMVEETRLEGLADHIVLPLSHSGMLVSDELAQQVACFLREGRFAR